MDSTNTILDFIVLRGLPGSGKSTYARQLIQKYLMDPEKISRMNGAVVFSTNDLFYDPDGYYQFDGAALSDYHQRTLNRVTDALKAEISLVILDNLNIKHRHYRHYVRIARAFHYNVQVLDIGSITDTAEIEKYKTRQLHNVPHNTYQKYIDEWETTIPYEHED